MSNIDVLNDTRLSQLWQKCLNTFGLRQEVYNNPKTLYNLGVYDSYVDNNDGTITITRQTGYISWVYLMEKDVQPGGSGNYNYFVIDDSIYNDLSTNYLFVNSYGLTNSAFSPVNSGTINNALAFVSSGTNDSRLCIRKTDSITSVDTLKSWTQANKLLVQYKKTTPYTEKVLKYQPLNTLNASGSAWSQEEYNKTLNLYNTNKLARSGGFYSGNLSWNSNSEYSAYAIKLKAGTYCYSTTTTTYSGIVECNSSYVPTRNLVSMNMHDANVNYTFTLSNDSYILFSAHKDYLTVAMINEGSTALPYQEYNGAIIHEKDITPVLLWENGSPNSSFTPQTITVSDMSKFKYIIIGVKERNATNRATQYFKASYHYDDAMFATFCDDGTNTFVVSHRAFVMKTTAIEVLYGYNNNSIDNNLAIPVKIYGSNI